MECTYCSAHNGIAQTRCVRCGRLLFPSTLASVIPVDRDPVALPPKRILAAVYDASMVLIALGLFVGVFLLSGGMLLITRQSLQFLASVLAVLALFYRFLWVLVNRDTPGMHFAGLRTVDFDGHPPDREQRGLRQVASILSLVPAGLGLLWVLFDKQRLSWHDRISKTFPTSA